jgi:hypothetical protein
MNDTQNKLFSSLAILGTASVLSLSHAPIAQGLNQIQTFPHQQTIPTEVLIAQNTNQPKYALVIGNSNYHSQGNLANPVNDAQDTGQALRDLGFDVTLITDASLKDMEDALDNFNLKLRQGGIGLFFFAGHGVQVDGENYLIPVDARLERQEDVRYETLPVGKVLGAMEDAGNEANFIILDACRNNPFGRQWRRSLTRGLAPQQSIKGSIIAYATSPGNVANDGIGRNGTYTSHLLKHIKTPGLGVEEMFKQVRQGVAEETEQNQIPWESSSLIGNFSFNPSTSSPSPPSDATSGPSRQSSPSFICAVDAQGIPTTYAQISDRPIPIFKWKSTSFPPPYTPTRRCEEVTQRLSNFKAQGVKLSNFQSGQLNQESVICVGPCASDGSNLLFTLRREQNPKQVLEALIASSRGAGGFLVQHTCPNTPLINENSDGTVTFDLENYLCQAEPEDTVSSSPSNSSPTTPNPPDNSGNSWGDWKIGN